MREQRADAVDGFKHGGGAAGGVDGAIDPGIAVIAGDDPIVGVLRAFDFSDHVPDDAALVVLLGDEVDLYAAGAEVIAEGQRALPALRHAGAFERLQDGRGIVIADGDGDDAGLVAGLVKSVMRAESGRSSVEATPGVSGSPGYLKRYWTEPRWTPVSGRQGPMG